MTQTVRSKTTTESSKVKICSKCKLPKSQETDFHKDARHKDGLYAKCKACHNAVVRRYSKTEKGRASMRASVKRYSQTEKGKACRSKWLRSEKGLAAHARHRATEGYKMVSRIYKLGIQTQRRVDKA